MRFFWILVCWAILLGSIRAQAQPLPTTTKSSTNAAHPIDTACQRAATVLEAFQKGHFHGHFRSFFMVTDNARSLSDYHALAAGGGLYFSSLPFRGVSFGLGGAFNFNVLSSDLDKRDAITGARNRYEIGLFDVENPNNRHDLDRLEDLWLRYQRKKWQLTVGNQAIQTPFINHQDGRMRPTVVGGAWVEARPTRRLQVQGGWLWSMSPRSTVRWYRIGESIGLYPAGLNPDGSASGYVAHLQSKGVGLLGVQHTWGRHLKMQYWNQLVENIFNTALLQADGEWPIRKTYRWVAGLQLTRQDALADGGHADARYTYFTKNGVSHILSTQVGIAKGKYRLLGAYTHITGEGRFLNPREWGREPFYTFLPRERIEGAGNVHAATLRAQWRSGVPRWQIEVGYGHFYLPDVKDVRLNKYAFPSFRQLNVDIRHTFSGPLEGLRAQLLYVWKGRMGNTYGNEAYVINRVDMTNWNLVLNYTY